MSKCFQHLSFYFTFFSPNGKQVTSAGRSERDVEEAGCNDGAGQKGTERQNERASMVVGEEPVPGNVSFPERLFVGLFCFYIQLAGWRAEQDK